MEHLEELAEAECTPEGLALGVSYCDLHLDTFDLRSSYPGERSLDQTSRDALTPRFLPHPDVRDLRAPRLFKNRRRVIDPHDAHPGQVTVDVEYEDGRVAIAMQLADQVSQGLVGVGSLRKQRVESRVVVRDRRPERSDAIEIPRLGGAYDTVGQAICAHC